MQNASLTEPVPPQALSSVALSSSICNSGDSMNEDKSTMILATESAESAEASAGARVREGDRDAGG